MNYKKLSVEDFALKLKEDGYNGPGGARRAIGKTGWTDKERDQARSLVDAHYGTKDGKGAAASTKQPRKAARTAPKRAAKPAKTPAVKGAAPKARVPAQRPMHIAANGAGSVGEAAPLEDVARSNAASNVISTLGQRGRLTGLEQSTYELAMHEYHAHSSEIARRAMQTAAHGIFPAATETAAAGESQALASSAVAADEVIPPVKGPSRIQVTPPGPGPSLDEISKNLEAAARATGFVPPAVRHA